MSEPDRPRAVIAAVQLPDVDDGGFASSLAELTRLAITLGLDVVGRVTQRRPRLAPGKALGDGKLQELATWTGGTGEVPGYQKPGKRKRAIGEGLETETETETDAETETETDAETETETETETDAGTGKREKATVVLVDHELSPTQQRNLEKATGVDVYDRTQVILGIFHRHARTREARLQVEIARLGYEAPRLRESGGGGDRVRGGVGGKGAGESSLELDRRRIRDRIAELRRELAQIEAGGKTRRQRRGDVRTIAVVGYTNAGKSSLMRALTGSEVYVADKLFATLDTTVRVLDGKVKPPILLSDTVGFIKKLPHDLVASFRSTLEEAAEADLLLQVVDASDAAFRDHMAVTRAVLGEVGADAPMRIVLNKADRLDPATRGELSLSFPDAIIMSAKDVSDVADLRELLVEHFAGAAVTADLMIPWDRHKLIHELHVRCRVLDEQHDEHGTLVTVKAPATIVDEMRALLAT
jgi:GTP-binding protein HflX